MAKSGGGGGGNGSGGAAGGGGSGGLTWVVSCLAFSLYFFLPFPLLMLS